MKKDGLLKYYLQNMDTKAQTMIDKKSIIRLA